MDTLSEQSLMSWPDVGNLEITDVAHHLTQLRHHHEMHTVPFRVGFE
jgi:hypothetical protein